MQLAWWGCGSEGGGFGLCSGVLGAGSMHAMAGGPPPKVASEGMCWGLGLEKCVLLERLCCTLVAAGHALCYRVCGLVCVLQGE